LTEAINLAKNQGAQLRLLHIVNEIILDYGSGSGVFAADIIESIRDGGKKVMDAGQALARMSGLDPEISVVESIGGPASELIVEQARKWPADLIVMGTHGRRGLRRFAMGSDAESVVRDTPVPVLVVHGVIKSAIAALKAVDEPYDASKVPLYA
jgi:nucleotide-binding universal stress UspA family protein